MTAAEKLVQKHWENVHRLDGSYQTCERGTILIFIRPNKRIVYKSWQDAAAFTLQRKEEIEEVKEEIRWISDVRDPLSTVTPRIRILRRLECKLAQLTEGWKP